MKRRTIIKLAAAGFVSWSSMASAQQEERIRRIGVLLGAPDADPDNARFLATFRATLQTLGWSEPRNLRIDLRVASDISAIRTYASELVGLDPDVLVAYPTPATAAIKRQASRIPVVFVNVGDPIGSGFVDSLSRPGGSMTGFTSFEPSLGGKWFDLLNEIAPGIKSAALLFNPDTAASGATGGIYLESAMAAAARADSRIIVAPVSDDEGIETVFRMLGGGGVIVNPNVFTTTHREAIVAAAAKFRVPAIYPYRNFADIGGLIAYGVERNDMFRGAATYVDRILKGSQASQLPVQQPTKFELLINLKTAKAMGFPVPATLVARADEVIE